MVEESSALCEQVAGWWREILSRTAASRLAVSVLYSGGLDSSLVAAGLRSIAEVELVTVGVPGSSDLLSGEDGARLLGLPWKQRVITLRDVQRVVQENPEIDRASPGSKSVQVAIALGLEATSRPEVYCGQGADELFLGYAHFEGIPADAAGRRRDSDLQKLLGDDWPLSQSIAARLGKRLHSPFLDPEFLNQVRALSIEQLRSGPARKPLLRQMAAELGLPKALAERPKKAFQYGSGVARLLRQSARTS